MKKGTMTQWELRSIHANRESAKRLFLTNRYVRKFMRDLEKNILGNGGKLVLRRKP